MARIRTIKPEFQKSASMGAVSRDARLLFILLWPECDDTGRCRADPTMLASILFPYDDDGRAKIVEWLFELEREECIQLYEANAHPYLQVLNWSDHQKIDHPSPSRFPAPPSKKQAKTRRKPRESSRTKDEDNTNPREHSRLDQGPRTKDQGEDLVSPSPRAALAEFDEKFWPLCPRKVGKGAAVKAFKKARQSVELETLVTAMRLYAMSRAGEDSKYTAHPKTWLDQERWNDEAVKSNGHDPPQAFSADRLAALQEAEETNRRKNAENADQLH